LSLESVRKSHAGRRLKAMPLRLRLDSDQVHAKVEEARGIGFGLLRWVLVVVVVFLFGLLYGVTRSSGGVQAQTQDTECPQAPAPWSTMEMTTLRLEDGRELYFPCAWYGVVSSPLP
jgi:hypothetical protein